MKANQSLRILIRYSTRLILGILLSIFLYLMVGLILSLVGTSPNKIECQEKNDIYVVSNGIHLDIIIPTELMKYEFVRKLNIPDQANFVSFGWGDKGFYLETPTWDQLKLSVAINAIFKKSESAMHVDYYYTKSNSWSKINVCEHQYAALVAFIMNSFEKNDEGHIIQIDAAGYFETDNFYEAKGSFSLIQTCNNWVNKGLKQSNIKTSIWSPFAYGVLYHVNKNKQRNERYEFDSSNYSSQSQSLHE